MPILRFAGILTLALICAAGPGPGRAQSDASTPTATTGPSTGLPIPRFVSIKASEANVRRGPSTTHRVDWVFRHPGLPVIVTAEYGHWRRVVDRDGLGGWVHYALLSGNRTVIVDLEMADLRRDPDRAAPVEARLERGVIARLIGCDAGWCEIVAGGHRGWAEAAGLWGVDLRGGAPAQ
ncbi:aspartyl-trna synthetase [Meridianimarinicoccus roseus]|uniref:Aspartyl-trna synthetase n=1 Tax=Meridianimarinicoccus roseus TaxID=2072018 RepID=A0A2V2LDS9_9RHOB|nr:SH3 domain-containing protein [Meridianimarinicoccus roseus]PWR01387.1 aspartyl-trna synthetase [Meridianimarinicoccus roseus]